MDFDPCAVSRMNEKKIVAPGSPASSLLSELRLRSIIENARQMCKVKPRHHNFLILCISCAKVAIFCFFVFNQKALAELNETRMLIFKLMCYLPWKIL